MNDKKLCKDVFFRKDNVLWRFSAFFFFLLALAGLYFKWERGFRSFSDFASISQRVLLIAACFVSFSLGLVLFLGLKGLSLPRGTLSEVFLWGIIILLTVLTCAGFYLLPFPLLGYGSVRLFLALLFIFVGSLFLYFGSEKTELYVEAQKLSLLFGLVYLVASFAGNFQATPFSLGWSEGSRFYNASLFDARAIYGQNMPLPVLHPSRYFLQAIPFFVGIRSILAHRIWQVILFLGLIAWGAWLFAKRIEKSIPIHIFWMFTYFFLFFFQGAVYYHLMVCVILVLLGYRKEKPWQTLLFVLLASLWAGVSRVNWMPLPALMAVALYLMDEPMNGRKFWDYVRFPLLWVTCGLAIAFAAKQGYMLISGEDATLFDSAMTSDLLWWRLWPNSTFSMGVIGGILVVCLPLALQCVRKLRHEQRAGLHFLRSLGLLGILLVFFGGGLVVSVKIGGGGDLHNMDAFLVLFVLLASSYIAGLIRREESVPVQSSAVLAPAKIGILSLCLVLVPMLFAFQYHGQWRQADLSADRLELADFQASLRLLENYPGKVLFVTERQLRIFGYIEEFDLIADYEKVFLMEMAMGNNQSYLQGYYERLASGEFKAIVFDPITESVQDSSNAFGVENNAWVSRVLLPTLEIYEPVRSWQNDEINLLIPRGQEELKQLLSVETLP